MSLKNQYPWRTLLTVVILLQGIGMAGEQTDIRGMGMSRASVASSRGLDAVGINPANLDISERGTVVIGLLWVGASIGTDMTTYGVFREYFNGVATDSGTVARYLTDPDKRAILDGFSGSAGRISSDLEFRPIGIAVHLQGLGSLAVTMTDRVTATADIPRSYAEFMLYGNPPGSVYDFSGARVSAQWVREYAVSAARSLPSPLFLQSLTGGISLKLLQGFGYASMEHSNTRFETTMNGVLHGEVGMTSHTAGIGMLQSMGDSGSVTPFPAPAGAGWGIDLGVSAEVNDYLRVGIAVTDIGIMSWNRDIEIASVDSTITIDNATVESQRKAMEDAFHGTRGPGNGFTTSLPTTLRVGGSIELQKFPAIRHFLFGDMTVAADMVVGFHDVPGASTRARFALGLEYRPLSFLPIRMGGSLGGETRSNFSLGIGFHLGGFDLDLASGRLGWLFNHDNLHAASVAFGMKVRI
jgi:hypothetical protein